MLPILSDMHRLTLRSSRGPAQPCGVAAGLASSVDWCHGDVAVPLSVATSLTDEQKRNLCELNEALAGKEKVDLKPTK